MSVRIEWARTPAALRLGLLVTIASQLARLVMLVVFDEDQLLRERVDGLESAVQALWVAGDILCLIGAAELARRSPRAATLVVAYAASLVMFVLWIGFEVYAARSTEDRFAWLAPMRYLEFATTLVMIAGWAILSRNAGLIVAIALTKIAGDLPPVADEVYARLGVESYRAVMGVHSVSHLGASCAALAIAMGVPFARPLVARVTTSRTFDAIAMAIGMTGAADVVAGANLLGGGMAVPLELVAIAGLLWFALVAAGSRGPGETGAWAMPIAGTVWAMVAVMRLELLPGALAERAGTVIDLGQPMWIVPLSALVGLVFVLGAVTRMARARGAEPARRVASVCALIVVGASAIWLLGTMNDAAIPGALRIVALAVAYAAAAYGVHAAGGVLGDGGGLPTATLRASS